MATDEQEALKGSGPNWFCGSCDCENPVYEETNCKNCGAPIGRAKTTPSKIKYPNWDAIPRTAATAVSFQVHEVDHGNAGWGMAPDEEQQPRHKVPISNLPHQSTRRSSSFDSVDYQTQTTSETGINAFLNQEIGSSGIKYSVVAWAVLILSVVLLIIYGVWYNYFDTVTKSAWVSSLGWTQNTKVEEYRQLSLTDWDENVPSDAYNSTCKEVIRDSNHKFSDGYKDVEYDAKCDKVVPVECKPEGDGAGGVRVPTGCTDTIQVDCKKTRSEEQFHYGILLDTSCTYNVKRWELVRNIPTSGIISVIPASGNSHQTYFDHGGYVNSDTIRVTEEQGTYTVNFSSEHVAPFSFDYSYDEWLKFDLQKNVSIEVNRKGKVPYKPTIEILK